MHSRDLLKNNICVCKCTRAFLGVDQPAAGVSERNAHVVFILYTHFSFHSSFLFIQADDYLDKWH